MSERGEAAAATVRAYLDALNRGSVDEAVRCVSDGFINEHTSALGETVVGREAYRERLGAFLGRFAGLHYQIEQMIVDGDAVAVAYRMSARCEERPFSIRGMFRFQLEGGHIVHRVDYWDSADFLRQVEIQPKR